MKKILLVLTVFFLSLPVVFAQRVQIGFDEKFSDEVKLSAEKNKVIRIPIYYESIDFNLYGVQADLEYDKDYLELVNYESRSNFNLMIGERIVAYRLNIDTKDNVVGVLEFKTKKTGSTIVNLRNIQAADAETLLEADDVNLTMEITKKINYIYILVPIITLLTGCVGMLIIKNNKSKRGKKK
ncbi:MAG: hypothetical protein IJO33_02740 [Bacilli bacterium]|nr:hypothetical protein [Bacilli bacterium]